MTSASHRSSIVSLTQEVSFLTEGKRQWEAETWEALRHIEALRDYASVLRSTLYQVEDTALLLQGDYAHRVKSLFDEPMDELRRDITAVRKEYERLLKEDVISLSPKYRTIVERVPPICVLFETNAVVNGGRMRLPPDVVEGIIPMVGRGKSRVFKRDRELTYEEYTRLKLELDLGEMQKFVLPDASITHEGLSRVLRQHDWCVISRPRSGICGSVQFYDDAGAEQTFTFFRMAANSFTLCVSMKETQRALVTSIVEDALGGLHKTLTSSSKNK